MDFNFIPFSLFHSTTFNEIIFSWRNSTRGCYSPRSFVRHLTVVERRLSAQLNWHIHCKVGLLRKILWQKYVFFRFIFLFSILFTQTDRNLSVQKMKNVFFMGLANELCHRTCSADWRHRRLFLWRRCAILTVPKSYQILFCSSSIAEDFDKPQINRAESCQMTSIHFRGILNNRMWWKVCCRFIFDIGHSIHGYINNAITTIQRARTCSANWLRSINFSLGQPPS